MVSKLVHNFVIFQLFRPFLHNGADITIHQFENGLSNYGTSVRYGEKMVYFGPP